MFVGRLHMWWTYFRGVLQSVYVTRRELAEWVSLSNAVFDRVENPVVVRLKVSGLFC